MNHSEYGSSGSLHRGFLRFPFTGSRTEPADVETVQRAVPPASTPRSRTGAVWKLTGLSLLALLIISASLLIGWWLLILICLLFLLTYLTHLLSVRLVGTTSGTSPVPPSPSVTLRVGGRKWTSDLSEGWLQRLEAELLAAGFTSMSEARSRPSLDSSSTASKSDESASVERPSRRSLRAPAK